MQEFEIRRQRVQVEAAGQLIRGEEPQTLDIQGQLVRVGGHHLHGLGAVLLVILGASVVGTEYGWGSAQVLGLAALASLADPRLAPSTAAITVYGKSVDQAFQVYTGKETHN